MHLPLETIAINFVIIIPSGALDPIPDYQSIICSSLRYFLVTSSLNVLLLYMTIHSLHNQHVKGNVRFFLFFIQVQTFSCAMCNTSSTSLKTILFL